MYIDNSIKIFKPAHKNFYVDSRIKYNELHTYHKKHLPTQQFIVNLL